MSGRQHVQRKSGVGYDWFRGVLQWPLSFVHERLAMGSVVIYIGPAAAKFAELFSAVGSVPG